MQNRKDIIQAKWRGSGIATLGLIKLIAESFANGTVDAYFVDGAIYIKFLELEADSPNISDVYNAVREVVPAHLTIIYAFMWKVSPYVAGFTRVKDVYNISFDESQQLPALNLQDREAEEINTALYIGGLTRTKDRLKISYN